MQLGDMSFQGVRRETRDPDGSSGPDGWIAVNREPTPEEVAELTDLVVCLTARLPVEDRPILSMQLEERSPSEIAAAVSSKQPCPPTGLSSAESSDHVG
ncbi:hypothetical protein [Frigoriglobus tundricola]|uniref:hypothetical protein n=1 Tax=Frigoriglobus tundricola TaxID=2774151 RepID=UPI00148E9F44|nr:hypothetical protein [Frigoriglobus tundricola]